MLASLYANISTGTVGWRGGGLFTLQALVAIVFIDEDIIYS